MWNKSEPSVAFHEQRESVDLFASLHSNDQVENYHSPNLNTNRHLSVFRNHLIVRKRWVYCSVVVFFLFLSILGAVASLQYWSITNSTNALVDEIKILKNSLRDIKTNLETLQADSHSKDEQLGNSIDTVGAAVSQNKMQIQQIHNKTDTVEAAVGHNTMQIQEIQNITEKAGSKIEYIRNVLNEMHFVVKLDCGGIVTLPQVKSWCILEFVLDEEYNNTNKHCIWTLQHTDDQGAISSNLKTSIKLTSYTFPDDDNGLFVLLWDTIQSPRLSAHKLIAGVYYITAEQIFLSFFSNNWMAGDRFSIKVSVNETTSLNVVSDWFSTTSAGARYGYTSRMWERMSIVVNPSKKIYFTAASIHTQNDPNRCEVYEIGSLGNLTQHPV